ncbi:MAG: substrate-binding domain-containing protein [Capnocytophaga sp.]|nr:substrate-binding domain-containing protein [Capnocytophaga sp.]
MQRYWYLFIFAAVVAGCRQEVHDKEITIGFSQCMTDDVWRQAMFVEMNIEASNYDNLEIIIKDAKEDNHLQISQIRELIAEKVDVLVISPNETEALTPVAVEAFEAGIPTIIVDRKINSDKYTSYIGGNSYEIGKLAGEYISQLLPDNATILEVLGTEGSSPARERHDGFMDGLDASKNFDIHYIYGNWRQNIAEEKTALLADLHQYDLVYAHNDVMAMGARSAFAAKDSTLLTKIKFIGVDGAFGKDAGLEAVAGGELAASFLYPTGGDEVVRTAVKIIRGEAVEKHNTLATTLIDKKTASSLLTQSDRLIAYQTKIEQQRTNLNRIYDQFTAMRYSLVTILLLLGIVVMFAVYAFIINKKIVQKNKMLEQKNEEIREVTAQKIRFFTNISHEIRTPITLIISPLEALLKQPHPGSVQTNLLRMHKNSKRLLRYINQLLDFRKVENDNLQLHRSETDLVLLLEDVKSMFDELAERKNITYGLSSEMPHLQLWIDADKIEKIFVNLLSNAFKFTPEGGVISLKIKEIENEVHIIVQDSGCGIAKEKQDLVFERFYTEDGQASGAGIGLNMSKEFVLLHGGQISVESTLGEGSIFTITLPKNLSANETQSNIARQVEQTIHSIDEKNIAGLLQKSYKEFSVLVVEDDFDVQDYLVTELSELFTVHTAQNGNEAIGVIENNDISLVVSDVMMPEMNGFELCRFLKNSPEMPYLPVILLTALADDQQQIAGIFEGADDYIRKPFNTDYLKVKIIQLLQERLRLQKRFAEDTQLGRTPGIVTAKSGESKDNAFMEKFVAVLEEKYASPELSVEFIADQMAVSRVHLYRKIKESSQLSPADYIRNFRLGKATFLLKENKWNISEIAYKTGFSSPAYFSKCFKSVFGMTPTEYV